MRRNGRKGDRCVTTEGDSEEKQHGGGGERSWGRQKKAGRTESSPDIGAKGRESRCPGGEREAEEEARSENNVCALALGYLDGTQKSSEPLMPQA